MGGAYTAVTTDAYAPVYNPGGLAFLPNPQLSGFHLSYLDSINYEFASLAVPLHSEKNSFGAIGASVQYLTTGDIPETDHFGNQTGNFSGHYASYNLAYGLPIGTRLGLGVTGKLISASIDGVSGSTFASDWGLHYRLLNTWSVGASFTNLGPNLKLLNNSDHLPRAFHAGTAFIPLSRWLVSLEGVFPTESSASFRGGLQYEPLKFLAIRAGYRTDVIKENNGVAGLSLGAGFQMAGQELAYAWLPYGDLGDTHYFSFLFRFGAKQEIAL